MQITVLGRHTYRVPPETGLVSLSLDAEAGSAREATAAASDLADEVAHALAELAAPSGPVSFHSVGALTTSLWRPSAPDGTPLPPRHHAGVPVRARFTDVTALAAFVSTWALRDGCQLHGVEWELTDATRDRLDSEALTSAVEDARRRAAIIARAAGAAEVVPVGFRDPNVAAHPQPLAERAMFALSADLSGGPSPLLAEDIVGQVTIEATYETGTVAP